MAGGVGVLDEPDQDGGWRGRRRWRAAAGDGEEGDGDATAPPLHSRLRLPNPLLTPCRSCAGLGPSWIPTSPSKSYNLILSILLIVAKGPVRGGRLFWGSQPILVATGIVSWPVTMSWICMTAHTISKRLDGKAQLAL